VPQLTDLGAGGNVLHGKVEEDGDGDIEAKGPIRRRQCGPLFLHRIAGYRGEPSLDLLRREVRLSRALGVTGLLQLN